MLRGHMNQNIWLYQTKKKKRLGNIYCISVCICVRVSLLTRWLMSKEILRSRCQNSHLKCRLFSDLDA